MTRTMEKQGAGMNVACIRIRVCRLDECDALLRVEDQEANTDSEDGPADTASGRDGASAEGGVRGENLQRHLLFVRAAHHVHPCPLLFHGARHLEAGSF